MDLQKFRVLSPAHRVLIALAVLLDGRDAGVYVENDAVHGHSLRRAAEDLGSVDIELRQTLAGSLLRAALEEL